MSVHLGIMGGGHYVAHCKNVDKKWYYYNDSSCREVTEERVIKENGYCLFYTAQGLDVEKMIPAGRAASPTDDPTSGDEADVADGERGGRCVVS